MRQLSVTINQFVRIPLAEHIYSLQQKSTWAESSLLSGRWDRTNLGCVSLRNPSLE